LHLLCRSQCPSRLLVAPLAFFTIVLKPDTPQKNAHEFWMHLSELMVNLPVHFAGLTTLFWNN